MTALEVLRTISPNQKLTSDNIFEALFEAGESLANGNREDPIAMEISIRLLEARRTKQMPDSCYEVVELLAEECGLYPYIDIDKFSVFSQVLIEAHSLDFEDKILLHSKQMEVLLSLLAGENVILSAPTSFGKSLLIDAFISKREPKTIVMILPTIALIDETRRRIDRRFGGKYKIITSTSELYDSNQPTVFILTQERFLQRTDIESIDLFFVDEFYKLDPSRHDSRYEVLNIALYKGMPKSRQCFLAGPHINTISVGDGWKGNLKFIKTDYRTVTVNVLDRSENSNLFETFIKDLKAVGDDSSIVFTKSPASAMELAESIVSENVEYKTAFCSDFSDWISENYHKDWKVVRCINSGIATHHGRLPRSLGQLFVQNFDRKNIKLLICTSTLIEGVNTAASNVFVYDKQINRTDFDFFSFTNIRGRVGRMMRHFVGNVYLYHQPPQEVQTNVDVPVLSDPDGSTDYIVMNVEPSSLNDKGKQRQIELPASSGLSNEIIRDHGTLTVATLIELKNRILQVLDSDSSLLIWAGLPNKEQGIALAELIVPILQAKTERVGLHSAKQIRWAWQQLIISKGMPNFLRWFSRTFYAEDQSNGVEEAFKFLQACEFKFGTYIMAIQDIVNFVSSSEKANYEPFAAGLETWFKTPWIKQIDEAGIPIPLAERLAKYLRSPQSVNEAFSQIRRLDLNSISDLSEIDRYIIESSFNNN